MFLDVECTVCIVIVDMTEKDTREASFTAMSSHDDVCVGAAITCVRNRLTAVASAVLLFSLFMQLLKRKKKKKKFVRVYVIETILDGFSLFALP